MKLKLIQAATFLLSVLPRHEKQTKGFDPPKPSLPFSIS